MSNILNQIKAQLTGFGRIKSPGVGHRFPRLGGLSAIHGHRSSGHRTPAASIRPPAINAEFRPRRGEPLRRMRSDSCACAGSGQVAAALSSSVMNCGVLVGHAEIAMPDGYSRASLMLSPRNHASTTDPCDDRRRGSTQPPPHAAPQPS
jgi:hypothetical protein